MSIMRSLQDENRPRDLRRIALYAWPDAGSTIETGCQALVLAAAHRLEKMSSCKECQAKIKELYGLQVELEEVSWAVRHLVKQGKLIESEQYRWLSEECRQEVTRRIRESNEAEAAAVEHWEWAVGRTFPELGTEQIAALREDLSSWIFRVVSDYGVETSVLCDPAHARYAAYAAQARLLSAATLPVRDPVVMMIREDALMVFFEKMTTVQLGYLQKLIASAYLMAVFTLDPTAVGGVHRLVNGQRLYLDTNLVYSLLKLNGPEKYLYLHRVLTFARSLGYQLCVTPWTVKEMEESVRFARMRLMRQRASPRDVAHLRPESETDEKYAAAYRRAQRDQGLSLKAFFELHEDVSSLLRQEHVDIIDQCCEEIDADERLIDYEITRLERVSGRQDKHRPVQEHDVKLKLLIERLRGTQRRRFSNMLALVLTNDHTLMQFAEQDEGRTGHLPFAVSLKKWSSIMRRLVPRTDDFDESLAQMHEAPALGASEFIEQKDIVRAIEYIRANERVGPETIVRSLVDSILADDDSRPDDSPEAPVARDIAAVESLMQRVFDLEAEVGDLNRQTLLERRDAEAKREEAAQTIQQLESRLRDSSRQLHQARMQLQRLRDAQAGRLAPTRSDDPRTSELAAEVMRLEARLRENELSVQRNEFRLRWGGGAMLAASGVGCCVLPLAASDFSQGWPLLLALFAGGLMLFGAIGWVFGKRRAGGLATAVGLVLGILASTKALVKDENQHAGSSSPPVTVTGSGRGTPRGSSSAHGSQPGHRSHHLGKQKPG